MWDESEITHNRPVLGGSLGAICSLDVVVLRYDDAFAGLSGSQINAL